MITSNDTIGIASPGLDKFLQDLGEKGLKKLGHSVESTYSTVQKLVVLNLEVRILTLCHVVY